MSSVMNGGRHATHVRKRGDHAAKTISVRFSQEARCQLSLQSNVIINFPILRLRCTLKSLADGTDHPGLRLLATRTSGSGASFHTLTLKCAAERCFYLAIEPSRPLVNDATRLGSKWVRMVEQTLGFDSPFNIYGSLIGFVPAQMGSHPVLDAAATFTVESYCAFKTQQEVELNAAFRTGAKALTALRETLPTKSRTDEDAILVAMVLHVVAAVRFVPQMAISDHG